MVQVYKHIPKTPKQAAKMLAPLDQLLNADLFKALGDPTRLLLLSCVAKCGRACSVGEVAECCSVDLSVVSRHLAVLARAGVLESSKAGRVVSYRVRYKEVSNVLTGLAKALSGCAQPKGKEGCC